MLGWLGVKGVPVEIPEQWKVMVHQLFPDLEEGVSLEFTSQVDYNYDCLSWALGCNSILFQREKGAFWPWSDIPDDTAEGWARLFELHGFTRTQNMEFRVGYEKVAILEHPDAGLHATRSDHNGTWKSKLGTQGPDIDHIGLDGIKSAYGEVVIVLERPRPDWEESEENQH
jgi:hypothetical protein